MIERFMACCTCCIAVNHDMFTSIASRAKAMHQEEDGVSTRLIIKAVWRLFDRKDRMEGQTRANRIGIIFAGSTHTTTCTIHIHSAFFPLALPLRLSCRVHPIKDLAIPSFVVKFLLNNPIMVCILLAFQPHDHSPLHFKRVKRFRFQVNKNIKIDVINPVFYLLSHTLLSQ